MTKNKLTKFLTAYNHKKLI